LLTLKQKLFVEAYLGRAAGNATEAARVAGYAGDDATLAQVGHENLRKPEISAAVQCRVSQASMETQEILLELSRVARMDTSTPGGLASKVRALEVLAKIQGLLNDRVAVDVSRESLSRELDAHIEAMLQDSARQRVARGLPMPEGLLPAQN
jgi:phage terminase small subunit